MQIYNFTGTIEKTKVKQRESFCLDILWVFKFRANTVKITEISNSEN